MIRSYLVLFGIVAVATEILSIVTEITYQGIVATWVILVSLLGWVAFRSLRRIPTTIWEWIHSSLGNFFKDLNWLDGIILASIGVILLVAGITAIISPPNNFDSMTYHMARVVHWIQNHSVRFYPTSISRQNYSMPLAEYMILHLQLLSRSDLYANLVQWSAFLILIILAGKIAELLGASRRGQYLAGLFISTLPIGILESSSTQNDILVAVFCLSFGYYLMRLIIRRSWSDTVLAGIGFGLALLTKGTAYIYCAGIGIPLALGGMLSNHRFHWLTILKRVVILVLLGLMLNTPFYLRNLDLYGLPLSTETDKISVDHLSIKGLYANLVRNFSANIAVPVPAVNQVITGGLRDHLGYLADDPGITFEGSIFRVEYLINDDEAGNLLQALLLIPLLGTLFFLGRKINPPALLWSGAVVLSMLLYSLLIKWQPWGTRLQLAIMAMAAPIFGLLVTRLKKSDTISIIMVLSLSLYSLPFLFLNSSRPLVPLFSNSSPLRSNKIKRFFSDRPDLYHAYAEIISPFYKDLSIFHTDRKRLYFTSQLSFYEDYRLIASDVLDLDQKIIGLATGANDWEYPLWVLTDQHYGSQEIIFINVGVNHPASWGISSTNKFPAYVIATKNADITSLEGKAYQTICDTPSIDLLERTP